MKMNVERDELASLIFLALEQNSERRSYTNELKLRNLCAKMKDEIEQFDKRKEKSEIGDKYSQQKMF